MIKLYCRIFMSYNNLFTNFFIYIKMSKKSSAKYYQGNKKRLQKKLMRDIKTFLRKKKKKKWQHGCEWYKNLPEDKKQKPCWVLKKILQN